MSYIEKARLHFKRKRARKCAEQRAEEEALEKKVEYYVERLGGLAFEAYEIFKIWSPEKYLERPKPYIDADIEACLVQVLAGDIPTHEVGWGSRRPLMERRKDGRPRLSPREQELAAYVLFRLRDYIPFQDSFSRFRCIGKN